MSDDMRRPDRGASPNAHYVRIASGGFRLLGARGLRPGVNAYVTIVAMDEDGGEIKGTKRKAPVRKKVKDGSCEWNMGMSLTPEQAGLVRGLMAKAKHKKVVRYNHLGGKFLDLIELLTDSRGRVDAAGTRFTLDAWFPFERRQDKQARGAAVQGEVRLLVDCKLTEALVLPEDDEDDGGGGEDDAPEPPEGAPPPPPVEAPPPLPPGPPPGSVEESPPMPSSLELAAAVHTTEGEFDYGEADGAAEAPQVAAGGAGGDAGM